MPLEPPQLRGKIFITGGSGFLGRGILHHLQGETGRFVDGVTIYSRDETKQYELRRRYPQAHCVLGDVRDLQRLSAAMAGHDIVLHVGAIKYIPEAEHNVAETIAVNVEGSLNVAKAAAQNYVKTVVGISTDKACAPLNTYGATKLLMERAFAEANRWGDTRFVTVRYGNVVGSTGSVIPVFRQQAQDYGEIRVTDPSMTRFWLGLGEAVGLIFLAASKAQEAPGSVFILPCPAMGIAQLAHTVRRLYYPPTSGVTPPIRFVGIRPGEKLHESLFNEQEAPRVVQHEGYFVLRPATEIAGDGPKDYGAGYISSDPIRWMEPDEMSELILAADGV